MRKIINGNEYIFEIIFLNGEKDVYFSIKATCKKTKRFSSINNLNAILSLLDVNVDNKKYDDSSWILPVKEAIRLFWISKKYLSDMDYLSFLENKLDDDRECGEWENIKC